MGTVMTRNVYLYFPNSTLVTLSHNGTTLLFGAFAGEEGQIKTSSQVQRFSVCSIRVQYCR